MPRASRCRAAPTVAAEDVGGLGVAQCGERPDGVDAEPVQLLLGDRPDAPQPAHRQRVEQHPLLAAGHHPDAVGFGQVRGDLGDLLARSGADGGDQSRFVENLGLQRPAERFDVVGRCTREFGGFAEGLVERKLLQDGHEAAHGVEHAAAGHAVDDAARRQHHRGGAHHPAGLVHGHRRSGAEHPGLVARARDHAATAEPADQDRPATQGGPGQLLDRREERVHVEVQHPAVHALINQSIRRKPAMNTTTYIVPDLPTPQNVPIPVSVANVDDWQHDVPLPCRILSGELRDIDGGRTTQPSKPPTSISRRRAHERTSLRTRRAARRGSRPG